jgi:hypothetical protein
MIYYIMNTLLNLVFLTIFSVFLFYWFQNLIKKNKNFLYVPYSSEIGRPEEIESEEIESEEIESEEIESEEIVNDLIQIVNTNESVTEENIIQRNGIFENWDIYI